uniref:Zinc finger and BTB domain-containing protein 5-like isoform X12 n=1 Tax=Crassostrea virginica TaxID=6565 RepID=A0A8B8AK25_CRAVI|nr:zinc finger and BTB domain-containing protein 5-like isoform X12 [Crassostrea virginica]
MTQTSHKVYMNHVHSSTLLSQLSTMWKSQTLCDAIIKTGPISTKAHRVVLVAACPMLQTMENATSGSHLEVRLASDISQESVNTFLQYLYEGYMILTDDNCSEVEKIARLLQVDSITKCCADFNKTVSKSAGAQFRYSFQDQTDFKHMRVSDLFRKQERSSKRANEMQRPISPGVKRQRMHTSSSPKIHDTSSMAESYGAGSDPWDRVPRLGSGFQGPGVVDIREDGIELVQTEPPKKDSSGGVQEAAKVQTSVSLSVSSQHNHSSDLRVVNVVGEPGPPPPDRPAKSSQAAPPSSGASSRDPITVSPLAFQDSPSSSSSSADVNRSMALHDKPPSKKEPEKTPQQKVHIPDYSDPQFTNEMMNSSSVSRSSEDTGTPYRTPYPVAMTQIPRQPQPKPFASGSASQSMPVFPETMSSPSTQKSQPVPRESIERPPSGGRGGDTGHEKSDDQPDLSIVKIETANERDMSNLEMYMGGEESFGSHGHQPIRTEEDDPGPEYSMEEPPGDWQREDMSNEGSNLGGMDNSGNWYMSQMKGRIDSIQQLKDAAHIKDNSIIIIKSKNDNSINEVHPYKRFDGKRFPCKYCTVRGVRAPKSGRILRSYHGCDTCGVALCRSSDRNCFYNYHKEVLLNNEIGDFYISSYSLYNT